MTSNNESIPNIDTLNTAIVSHVISFCDYHYDPEASPNDCYYPHRSLAFISKKWHGAYMIAPSLHVRQKDGSEQCQGCLSIRKKHEERQALERLQRENDELRTALNDIAAIALNDIAAKLNVFPPLLQDED